MSKLGAEPQHEVVYIVLPPAPAQPTFCRRRAFFGLLVGTGLAFLWVRSRSCGPRAAGHGMYSDARVMPVHQHYSSPSRRQDWPWRQRAGR
jgi:hypothetical protein